MGQPIRPEEIVFTFPDYVTDAVNDLLKENFRNPKGEIKLMQKDIVNKMLVYGPAELTKQIIMDKKYLDFEKLYEEYGWKVTYHKPDYTENDYPHYFIFKPK